MTDARAAATRYWVTWILRRRPRGLVAVVLLVGLVGGVALGAIAGARRTQSAFPAYLRASHASDLQVVIYHLSSFGGGTSNFGAKLKDLPDVTHVATAPFLFLAPPGAVDQTFVANEDVNFVGSVGGAYTHYDQAALLAGSLAVPSDPDQVVATPEAASLLGWHLGERIPLAAFGLRQIERSSTFPPPHVTPFARVTVTLVGLVSFASQVAHDDVDRNPSYVLFTPALTARLAPAQGFPDFSLTLAHGSADVPLVEREILAYLPPGSVYQFHVTSVVAGQVERATRPESIALALFGLIAGAAALLVGAQALRRTVWAQRDEARVARALGADRATRVAQTTTAPLGATVLGALLAVAVAIAISPVAPLGAVRQIDEHPGIAVDALVLVIGALLLVVGLGAYTVVAGIFATRPDRDDAEPASRSRVAEAAARAGLPVPAVAGLRFSLSADRRDGAPVRSALVASALAVAVVVATATFADGLSTLDSHPALYGWNWTAAILSPDGSNLPPTTGELLSRDHFVAAWSGYNFANVQIDGLTVPLILSPTHAAVGPALLAGHEVDGSRQIVLGAATMAQLHRRLGQEVTVTYGAREDYPVYVPPTTVTIVGVATMPAIGQPGNLHTSMGLGAMLANAIEPAAFREAIHQPDVNLDGPVIDVVRLRGGVSAAAGLASLHRIAHASTILMDRDPRAGGPPYVVVGPQRPAEIVAYEASGATPAVLALALAAGATAALALALTSSVRRRRRDLGMLKTLGFTRRQLASTVAAQSTVVALVGVLVGTPVGVALGRWLWILFARQIGAVPDATIPTLQLVAIAVGALVLANVIAAVPGRIAARTPAALVLRSE